MTQATDPRADKIRKLFAMADDESLTEPARESYRDKATTLMIQWEIDEARLAAAGDERVKSERIIQKTFIPQGPTTYGYDFVTFAATLADVLGLRAARTQKHDGKARREAVVLVGFEGDVERLCILFESLLTQCLSELGRFGRTHLSSYLTASQKYQARRSFIIGFGGRVATRLQELRDFERQQEKDTHGTGTDLVLVDRKKQVETFVSQLGWGKGKGRQYGLTGIAAGQEAGSRADLGQSRFGTAARGALGK